MENDKIIQLRRAYNQIEVPQEINMFIKKGLEKGRNEINNEYKNQDTNKNLIMKVCASIAIMFVVLTASINIYPSFAQSLKKVPLIGELVKVLQFVEGESSGGKITDGVDVNNIAVEINDGYEDIILNFEENGVASQNTAAFKMRYQENPYTITFEVGGARRFSAKENFEKILESKYVRDVYPLMTMDDSMIRFVVEFKQSVKYEVKEMKSPASIVMRIKEDNEAEEKIKYSVRTKSYDYGEELGMAEESLMWISQTRMLKDVDGKYFVEAGVFDTKLEAEQKVLEISEKSDIILKIEERSGNVVPQNYK